MPGPLGVNDGNEVIHFGTVRLDFLGVFFNKNAVTKIVALSRYWVRNMPKLLLALSYF
jgi:hypothetical protein